MEDDGNSRRKVPVWFTRARARQTIAVVDGATEEKEEEEEAAGVAVEGVEEKEVAVEGERKGEEAASSSSSRRSSRSGRSSRSAGNKLHVALGVPVTTSPSAEADSASGQRPASNGGSSTDQQLPDARRRARKSPAPPRGGRNAAPGMSTDPPRPLPYVKNADHKAVVYRPVCMCASVTVTHTMELFSQPVFTTGFHSRAVNGGQNCGRKLWTRTLTYISYRAGRYKGFERQSDHI